MRSDDLDNPTGPGSTTLFSSIQNVTQFANSAAPFPIIYSTGRELFQANITIANPNVSTASCVLYSLPG